MPSLACGELPNQGCGHGVTQDLFHTRHLVSIVRPLRTIGSDNQTTRPHRVRLV
jgi:hypothetical protein